MGAFESYTRAGLGFASAFAGVNPSAAAAAGVPATAPGPKTAALFNLAKSYLTPGGTVSNDAAAAVSRPPVNGVEVTAPSTGDAGFVTNGAASYAKRAMEWAKAHPLYVVAGAVGLFLLLRKG